MPKFNPKTEYTIVPQTINVEDFHKFSEEYVVRPPYQRKTVWGRKKQQALLDSLFRRYYIPRIVIREVRLGNDETVNEVVDGQQRITTVQDFLANKLPLPKTLADIRSDLPGKLYADLSVDVRRFVDRLTYDADIVKGIADPKNPDHQKIATEIFWRLQQGESLNYMEVAHSRLSSLARNFVVKYADDQRFDYDGYEPLDDNPDKHLFFKVISRPNNRMQQLGLLSRLLMIEDADGPTDLKNSNVTKFIDDYQRRDGIDNWSLETKPFARRLLRTMTAFYEIFKDDPMVKSDVGMKEFKDEYVIISFYLLLRHLRRHYVVEAPEKQIFYDFTLDFTERLRGARRGTIRDLLIFSDHRQQSVAEITIRDQILRQAFFNFAKMDREHEMRVKDDQRVFNEAQRIEIYRRDNGLCQMCLAEGKSEVDAFVPWTEYEADHVIPHARGGATVVDNAQLLCRNHNRAKGASTVAVPIKKRVVRENDGTSRTSLHNAQYPLTIRAQHQGKTVYAKLLDLSGNVRFDGTIYNSPTAACKKVTNWLTCNGWKFWKYQDIKTEKWQPISDLR